MELISSDSLSVCEITLHRCDKEDASECGHSHDGATLIAVIPFTAVDFQGGGKNAIVAVCRDAGRFG